MTGPGVRAARRGRLLLVVLLVVGVLCGAMVALVGWQGRSVERQLADILAEGYRATQAEKVDLARAAFDKADALGWGWLSLARALHLCSGVSRDEVRQLRISVLLMQAYAAMFLMKPGADPLALADKAARGLEGAGRDELQRDVATALAAEKSREQIAGGQVREGLRTLLAAEKGARESDLDFFIQEIRLLIAAGKKVSDDGILNRARELLWLLSSTTEKNPRINQLWGILARP